MTAGLGTVYVDAGVRRVIIQSGSRVGEESEEALLVDSGDFR